MGNPLENSQISIFILRCNPFSSHPHISFVSHPKNIHCHCNSAWTSLVVTYSLYPNPPRLDPSFHLRRYLKTLRLQRLRHPESGLPCCEGSLLGVAIMMDGRKPQKMIVESTYSTYLNICLVITVVPFSTPYGGSLVGNILLEVKHPYLAL